MAKRITKAGVRLKGLPLVKGQPVVLGLHSGRVRRVGKDYVVIEWGGNNVSVSLYCYTTVTKDWMKG